MSLLPMLSHITNTTRFEICHVMKIQLWIGKSLDRDGRWTEQWTVKCINQSSNSIQTLTYNNCILHSHLSSRWSHSTWNVLWEPKILQSTSGIVFINLSISSSSLFATTSRHWRSWHPEARNEPRRNCMSRTQFFKKSSTSVWGWSRLVSGELGESSVRSISMCSYIIE